MPRTPADQYSTIVTKPADFDHFWEGVLAQSALIPLDASVELDPMRTTDEVEVYRVHYTSLDHVRISGWYCLPRERSGPLPAIIQVPGYLMDPRIPKAVAKRGYAAFAAAPRGKVGSRDQFNPGYPGLLTYSIMDRNTYSYRGFYVDVWRIVDFLLGRDEVDSGRIGVDGHSQGGGLSVLTAAMRPEIAAASSGAPYLCGFMDSIQLTHTYPYQEITDYLRVHPEQADAVEETLAYFDGINFADKITCPIIVSIGLQDNVCPPETGYAMFNCISSQDKRLYAYDGHGHDANQHIHAGVINSFFDKHLKGQGASA